MLNNNLFSINGWNIFRATILVILLSVIYSCGPGHEPVIEPVPRDVSVTVENSYTKIFIDSMLVEKFIGEEQINDTTAQQIRNFYNKRNYSYAWFTDTGFTVQAQAFWSIHNNHLEFSGDSSIYHEQLHAVMDTLMEAYSAHTTDTLTNAHAVQAIDPALLATTEMRLTAHFFGFIKSAFGPKANPETMHWNIPVKKIQVDEMLDSLLAQNNKDWRPLNRYFHRMQNAIFLYDRIQKQGGWDSLPVSGRKIGVNDRSSVVKQVKRRLALVNLYPAADTSDLMDDSLGVKIQKLRAAYGLKEDKQIDSFLIKELNVSVEQRLKQMLINLERFKWLPDEPERFIFVNIPDYSFFVSERGKPVMKMKVVVGKAVNRTVIFSGDLKYVVFSPYWNIPPSIVRNEVLPAMKKDRNYLAKNNFEVTGQSGGLPVIRQKPGVDNALGQVKFLFPNEYNIYLHDTNAKGLFERADRAFSHGCIRISRPFDLAKYLLQEDSVWTDKKIRAAMGAKVEKWVTLKKPAKVFILYITSWVDMEGFVHFRKDIYSHDKNMAKVIFE